MSNLYEKIVLDDNHYVNIFYDESSDSPREWNDQTKMCIREHRHYSFPNELDINFEALEDNDFYGTDKSWKKISVAKNEKEKFKGYHVFEMDCYIHSWVAFSLSGHGMQCRFDTSSNCWYFCVPKTYEDGMITYSMAKISKKKAIEIAKKEIEIYNQYINWEVYWFKLMQSFPPVEKDWKTYYAKDKEIECECQYDIYDLKEIAKNIPQEYKEVFLKSI